MKILSKFILLFIISFQFSRCDLFKFDKEIDNIQQTFNKAIQDLNTPGSAYLFDDLKIVLKENEKNIIKDLFTKNIESKSVQFALENLEVNFSKKENSSDPDYYVNFFQGNSLLKDRIIPAIQEIFQIGLHKTNTQNNDNLFNLVTFKKNLLLSYIDQVTLINFINPLNENTNQFLANNNIDVQIDLKTGNMKVIFKKTYYHDFLNQTLNNEKISIDKFTSTSQYETFLLDVSNVEAPLDQVFNLDDIKMNTKFKITDSNAIITYGNFLYALLNNDEASIETIVEHMKNLSTNLKSAPSIYIKDVKIDANKKISFKLSNRFEVVKDFLSQNLNMANFTFTKISDNSIRIDFPKSLDPILHSNNITTMILEAVFTKPEETNILSYANFFYYVHYYTNFHPEILKVLQAKNPGFDFSKVSSRRSEQHPENVSYIFTFRN